MNHTLIINSNIELDGRRSQYSWSIEFEVVIYQTFQSFQIETHRQCIEKNQTMGNDKEPLPLFLVIAAEMLARMM